MEAVDKVRQMYREARADADVHVGVGCSDYLHGRDNGRCEVLVDVLEKVFSIDRDIISADYREASLEAQERIRQMKVIPNLASGRDAPGDG